MGTAVNTGLVGRRFLLTVAVDRYQHLNEVEALTYPAQDADRVADLLRPDGYEHALRIGNYWSAHQVLTSLSHWAKDTNFTADDLVVFYFAGHGLVEEQDRHYLLCWDSRDDDPSTTAIDTGQIVRVLARQGIQNLLLIFDTCYAAAGAAVGAQVALRTIARQSTGDTSSGVWFLSSARTKDEAGDGTFVDALQDTITEVHDRTGQRQRYLDLADVVTAVNDRFRERGIRQRAELSAALVTGLPPFLLNRGYRADLPREDTDLELQRRFAARELHDHFGPRSRGVEYDSEQGLYFHGRSQVLGEIVDWLTADQSDGRGRVVTGRPGCGKSAVIGRIVAMSDPSYRDSLLAQPDAPGSTIPPGLVDVAIHARHKRLPEIVDQIAAGLGFSVDGVGQLLRELGLTARSRPRPYIIVVDALDEAGSGTAADTGGRGEPRRVARELLRPLSDVVGVRLLVGTRRELITSLDPTGSTMRIHDLDDENYLDDDDLAEYVARILLATDEPDVSTPYRDLPPMARTVGAAVAKKAAGVFLIARMTARGLRTDPKPVDLSEPGWEERLPSEIGEAFEDYLDRFGPDEERLRTLLYPLAFAEGKGLPRGPLWTGIASALGASAAADADLGWLLERAQAYLSEVTDGDRSVYRLYHQALAEHLRSTYKGDAQNRIVGALLSVVQTTADGGRDYLSAPPYVQIHLATHAAAADRLDELVEDPGFLLAADQLILLRALPTVRSESARQARSAYEQVAHQLTTSLTVGLRAAYLQLSARRCDANDLADRIDRLGLPMSWQARWAWWSKSGVHRQLIGHKFAVSSAAIGDLDGQPIAVTGGADKTLRIWDLVTQRQLGAALEHGSTATAIAVGEIGEYSVAVSGSESGELRVWDLSSGYQLSDPLVGHTNAVTKIVLLSEDGRTLAVSASRDGTARVWDLNDKRGYGTVMAGHGGPVLDVAVTEIDGRLVVLTAGGDHRVRFWDLAERNQLGDELIGHTAPVTSVSLSAVAGRRVVVTGSQDGTIGLWDLYTRRQVGEPIAAHTATVGGVSSLATGELNGMPITISCGDNTARLWNLASGQPVGQPLAGHFGQITTVVMGAVGRTPIGLTASWDETARIWDLTADQPLDGHTSGLTSATVKYVDGHHLALTGSTDTTAVIWDLDSGGRQDGRPLSGHRVEVTAVLLGTVAGEAVAVTGSGDAAIRLWNIKMRQEIATVPVGHTGPITALELMHVADVAVLASGSGDGTVRLWNLKSGSPLVSALRHSADVDLLASCEVSGQTLLLAGTRGGRVTAWDVPTGRLVATLEPPEHWSTLAIGGVDGRAVALVSSSANALQLWDVLTGVPVGPRMIGHTEDLVAATLGHHDDRPIAVAAEQGGIARIWDLRVGRESASPLVGERYGTSAIAIGPSAEGTAVLLAGSRQTRLYLLPGSAQQGDALTGGSTDVNVLALGRIGTKPALVCGGNDSTVRVLDLETGKLAGAVLNGHQWPVYGAAVVETDLQLAITADYGGSVRGWDLVNRRQHFRWAHTDRIHDVRVFSRDGRPTALLASATVQVWDIGDRVLIGELAEHTGDVIAMSTADIEGSPSLLTGSADGTSRLWNLRTLAPMGPILAGNEDDDLVAVTLSRLGDQLTALSGHRSGVVRRWNPLTGNELPSAVPRLHESLSVLVGGEMYGRPVVAIAGTGGTVRLWCELSEVTVAEVQLAIGAQDMLITPDGGICIATVTGVIRFHVPDWNRIDSEKTASK